MEFFQLVFTFVWFTTFGLDCQNYPSSEVLEEIATFRTETADQVKKVFMSKNFKLSWMNANLFCLNNQMELLRIESQLEFSKIKRALKLHWLDFDSQLYIDGIFTDDKWKFLSNRNKLDANIYNVTDQDFEQPKAFMALRKINFDVQVKSNYFTSEKFLCQKLFKDSSHTDDSSNSLQVNMVDRLFEKIGWHNGDVYINRDYQLSPSLASSFCQSFGMNLATIESKNDFDRFSSLVAKKESHEHFMVGTLRTELNDFFEAFHYSNLVYYTLDLQNCVAIQIIPRAIRKNHIYYFNCDKSEQIKKLKFVCVSEGNGFWNKLQANPKKTVGLKLLGMQSFEHSAQKLAYYMNDLVSVSSWFEAFLYCKSLGMDLFSPKSEANTQQVIELLRKHENSFSFYIGGSSIGTEAFWYSTKTGAEITVDMAKIASGGQCLGFMKIEGQYELRSMSCDSGTENFICESSLNLFL